MKRKLTRHMAGIIVSCSERNDIQPQWLVPTALVRCWSLGYVKMQAGTVRLTPKGWRAVGECTELLGAT
jgi:hypothetical protein